jgi:hypothetical protein
VHAIKAVARWLIGGWNYFEGVARLAVGSIKMIPWPLLSRSRFRTIPSLWQHTHKAMVLQKLSIHSNPSLKYHGQMPDTDDNEAATINDKSHWRTSDGTENDERIIDPPEEDLLSTWRYLGGYYAFATPGREVSDYTLLCKVRDIGMELFCSC